ncbi:MAG: carboxypeptidase-like regulatory domain-containing protein [Parabacteroides sp.]|nr:carboxypeptidase-like regulatory domain-containing protein [Parabacteroides sp.]
MNLFNMLEMDSSPALKKILSIMRLTTLFLIVFSLNISATVYSQNTKLSLDVRNQSIKEVLYLIENQSDFRFIYESGKVNLDKKVSIRAKAQSVDAILKKIFDEIGVEYEITENNFVLIDPAGMADTRNEVLQQERKKLVGIVKDKNGEPVIGANIMVKGFATVGTVTDLEGKFILEVNNKAMTLLISYIGYVTQEVEINGRSTFDILLQEDALSLDELVVVGYGTQRK